jgi:hypothetical protein
VFRTPIDDLTAYDTFQAASVVHYFRPDRPGQLRGIPDITPALPLFAQLRRYTLATIAAAETAANFAAVIYTDSPANGEADPLEPMDEVELEQRLATVLPGGWKLGQVHAEQPTTTFGEFKREILIPHEIAPPRCLNMPFNVVGGGGELPEVQLRQRSPRPPGVLQEHPPPTPASSSTTCSSRCSIASSRRGSTRRCGCNATPPPTRVEGRVAGVCSY